MLDERELAAEIVLDVARERGIVARLAKERVGETGSVVGVDLSRRCSLWRVERPGYRLARRRRQRPAAARSRAVRCRRRRARTAVLLHRLAAARQMHRALAAGGRLAVSTWRPDEEVSVAVGTCVVSWGAASGRSLTGVTVLARPASRGVAREAALAASGRRRCRRIIVFDRLVRRRTPERLGARRYERGLQGNER